MDTKIIGEIIGGIAIAENLLVYSCLKRDNMLRFKFLSDILWAVSFLLIGAYTGAVLNVIAMLRETVFYFKGKKKFASHGFWLPVFLCLTLLSPAIEWLGKGEFSWIPLIPAIGSMVAVVGLYQESPMKTRYLALVAHGLWLVYAIFVSSISNTLTNTFLLISAVIGIVRECIIKKHNREETKK